MALLDFACIFKNGELLQYKDGGVCSTVEQTEGLPFVIGSENIGNN